MLLNIQLSVTLFRNEFSMYSKLRVLNETVSVNAIKKRIEVLFKVLNLLFI